MGEYTRVSRREYYRTGYGTLSLREKGWYGSNSITAEVDCYPTVGPFPSREEAAVALESAVDKLFPYRLGK